MADRRAAEGLPDYPGARNSRRITFEYAMLKGVNDSDADARELVRILKPIHAKVEPDPFNPCPARPTSAARTTVSTASPRS